MQTTTHLPKNPTTALTAGTTNTCLGLCGGTGDHDDSHCVQPGVTVDDQYGNPVTVAAYAELDRGRVGVYVDGQIYDLGAAARLADALNAAVVAAVTALVTLDEGSAR